MLCPIAICTSHIEVSGYLVPVSFVVLPLCSHDLVLGISFFREHVALISCRTGELTISLFPPADYWVSTNIYSIGEPLIATYHSNFPFGGLVSRCIVYGAKDPVVVYVVTEMNQTVLLQKNITSPTSLVVFENGHTSMWAINFGYQTCRLSVGLVVTSFCETPNFAEIFIREC